MMHRILMWAALSVAALVASSCGPSEPGPLLISDSRKVLSEGESKFRVAEAAEQKGDLEDAIELYDETATEYPFATSAPDARFRQAQLLDKTGEPRKAFEVYDKLIAQYPTCKHYSASLERLSEIAHDALAGRIKTNFLGIKGKLDTKTVVEMLGKVRDHAPKSSLAAKAQYAIGEAYRNDGNRYNESVAAFRQLVADQPNHAMAAEAQYMVGKILLESAQSGNQNQANIDLCREAFNDYLAHYSGHKRAGEVRQLLSQLESHDLQRTLDIADYYVKTNRLDSARIYYRDILKRSNSGAIHDKASARLKEIGN